MKFMPKTQQEIDAMGLITAGIYYFQVLEADEQVSRSGNDMIKLKIQITDDNNRPRILFDYILEAFAKKLKNFCEVTGLLEKYNLGELCAEDCIAKTGYVDVEIQPETTNAEGKTYSAKNSVKDYVVEDNAKDKEPYVEFTNDDVPF